MKKSYFWKADWFLVVAVTLLVLALGTLSYLAPQQLSGKKVDGASDMFSPGVTLYQRVSGHLPFTGDSMTQRMYIIANEVQQDMREHDPNLPACVAAIANKALAKDPEQRYQSCDPEAQALRLRLSNLRGRNNKSTAETARA
jgi:serine/threonine protein kinase